jgi:hypothetical protein
VVVVELGIEHKLIGEDTLQDFGDALDLLIREANIHG